MLRWSCTCCAASQALTEHCVEMFMQQSCSLSPSCLSLSLRSSYCSSHDHRLNLTHAVLPTQNVLLHSITYLRHHTTWNSQQDVSAKSSTEKHTKLRQSSALICHKPIAFLPHFLVHYVIYSHAGHSDDISWLGIILLVAGE